MGHRSLANITTALMGSPNLWVMIPATPLTTRRQSSRNPDPPRVSAVTGTPHRPVSGPSRHPSAPTSRHPSAPTSRHPNALTFSRQDALTPSHQDALTPSHQDATVPRRPPPAVSGRPTQRLPRTTTAEPLPGPNAAARGDSRTPRPTPRRQLQCHRTTTANPRHSQPEPAVHHPSQPLHQRRRIHGLL